MPEKTLYSKSALDGLSMTAGETHIHEESLLSIVSVAVPQEAHSRLDERLNTSYGVGFPRPGSANRGENSITLLGLQSDQCLLVSSAAWQDPVAELTPHLGDCAYLTDQSDSWAVLVIKGPLSIGALERMSPIDLSSPVFTNSSVARTAMEHMSVIIEQPSPGHFTLYTPRSTAQDFAHALCTSLANVND